MENFYLNTERLIITEFNESMIESVQENSIDEDTRRFVPDEVFETIEEACKTVLWLMDCYKKENEPCVYPVLLKNGENIGYVQAVPLKAGWEIGYHIAKIHTRNGYATEAIKAFLPIIMERLNIKEIVGICLLENIASCKVMERCGFVLEYQGVGNYQGNEHEICRYKYILSSSEFYQV